MLTTITPSAVLKKFLYKKKIGLKNAIFANLISRPFPFSLVLFHSTGNHNNRKFSVEKNYNNKKAMNMSENRIDATCNAHNDEDQIALEEWRKRAQA